MNGGTLAAGPEARGLISKPYSERGKNEGTTARRKSEEKKGSQLL